MKAIVIFIFIILVVLSAYSADHIKDDDLRRIAFLNIWSTYLLLVGIFIMVKGNKEQ